MDPTLQPPEQPWTVLKYFSHGYSVDCGYCRTSWRGVAGSQEKAEEFLAQHQALYCVGRKHRDEARG